MYGRLYLASVIGLWLASMTWLVMDKVLPPLRFGEPPSYRTMIESPHAVVPVGWSMLFNDRPLGWAVTSVEKQPGGQAKLHSRVHFDRLPLADMSPSWLFALWRLIDQPVPPINMDVESTIDVSSDGDLIRFQSLVRLEPLASLIELSGRQEGNRLTLTVQAGDVAYTTETYLQAKALLGEALSPQAELPGLRLGQRWTIPIYSPLRPPNSPIEVFNASVEGWETIDWQGQGVQVWVVAYRNESGFASARYARPEGRLWVTPEGSVLRQEAVVMDRALVFVRLTDQQTRSLLRRADQPAVSSGTYSVGPLSPDHQTARPEITPETIHDSL